MLFSRNSPKPTSISPESHKLTTLSLTPFHSSSESILWNPPSSSNTIGPSISTVGVTAAAFPGRSTFICVPTARNPCKACIETGLTPAAASPEALLRPYLSLNAPGWLGSPKTGRPAMISCMNFLSLGISLPMNSTHSPLSFFFLFHSSVPLEVKWAMKSQPGILSRSVCFWTFGALRQSPSPITSRTPPLTLAPSILRTSLYPEHSMSSVGSPLIITGQARTIISISSGGGLYCNPFR